MIVLDASVFVKLFREEEGSEGAHTIFRGALNGQFELVAPEIMKYEVLGVAVHYAVPFITIISLINDLHESGFEFLHPTPEEMLLAEAIATTPAVDGGYADLFDSIYHAIALSRDGMFLTADPRYVARAGHRGSVQLLGDWQPR